MNASTQTLDIPQSRPYADSLSDDATLSSPLETTIPLRTPQRVPILRYDEFFNQRTRQTTLRKTGKPQISRKVSSKRPVFVVRRKLDSRGQLEEIVYDIKSDRLRDFLIELHQTTAGLELSKAHQSVDHKFLFHSYDGLSHGLLQASATNDDELVYDIETALQLIREDLGQTMAEFASLTSSRTINFELLWALFRPNTHVYHHYNLVEEDRVLRCRSFSYERTQEGPIGYLLCDIVCDDGQSFGVTKVPLVIPSFRDSCKITDLPVYPLSYHHDPETIRTAAISRGRRFSHVRRQCYETSGHAGLEGHRGSEGASKANCHGRVMIDPPMFRVYRPASDLIKDVIRRLDKDELTDDDYLIFNPAVLGYSFASKLWGVFAPDRLQPVQWSKEPFDRLVLGSKQKRHIHSLVQQHSEGAKGFDDVVIGKGQGLVGLLCGNPGCGKTLTAEAVSEIIERPLLSINAGDLGTEPDDVETTLSEMLELAEHWGAILLLDEADVFLQKRGAVDISRNALVSIFLRHLEYYKGVIILTTNLPEQCDPAFESRIHFCVKYPDLDYKSRREVWKTFLSKITAEVGNVTDQELDSLAKCPLNGRQIKNVVSSARSLALKEGVDKCQGPSEKIRMVLEVMHDWHLATTMNMSMRWDDILLRPVVVYSFVLLLLCALKFL